MNRKEDFWKTFVLILICLISVIGVVLGQNFRESYLFFAEGVQDISSGWIAEYQDATGNVHSKNVALPLGLQERASGEVVLTNEIPDSVQGNQYLFVVSNHQEVTVSIDGEERIAYQPLALQHYGLIAPHVILSVPLYEEDAGKALEIHYSSYYNKFQNYIRPVFWGTQTEFIYFLLHNHWIDIVVGIGFVGIGLIYVITSMVLRYRYQLATDVHYLGYFALMNGIWIMLNCKARQLYLSNLFIADKVSYTMMALYCIPCLWFLDSKQNGRYRSTNRFVAMLMYVNYLVLLGLDIFNVLDFAISQIFIYIMILLAFSYACIVFFMDIRKKDWKAQIEIMIAFLIIAVSMILKIVEYQYGGSEGYLSNPVIYFGVLFMVIIMGTGNLRGWYQRERETQKAINANQAKTLFLANMSHEIRTPISAILGMNEMIIRESESVSVQNYAHKIKKAGGILVSLVNDILDISKIESGKMELVQKEYDTTNLLADIINMSIIRAENKNLEFRTKISEKLPRKMYGDDMRIRQVINNMLSNAVKYTNQGSVTFEIGLEEDSDKEQEEGYCFLRVSVSDTGVGIREEDIVKLTEAFVRFDEVANRNVEGTGLGMAITSKCLSMMDSKLEIASVYGRGSKFSFVLRQKIVDDTPIGNYYDTAYKAIIEQKEKEENRFIAPKAKVLVVDDNEINLQVIVGLLKEIKVQVTSVTSGYKALELVKNVDYDLILMDHMMPVMDGIETLSHIRNLEHGKNVPVIVLTANAIEGAREEYLKAGFNDYLAKPIDVEELENSIRKHLSPALIEKPFSKRIEKNSEGALEGSAEALKENTEKILIRYGINAKEGIRYSAGKTENYKIMLKAYLTYDEERRKKLAMAIVEKKLEKYTVEIHALKGNAKGIGAGNLSQLAYNHETESRKGNLEYLEQYFPELLREMDRTLEGVKEILALLDISP